jgi:outer membrane protein assembly factor BamD (BamD/ComL family)
VDINRAWETIRDYKNFSQTESRLLWTEEAYAMVRQKMLKIISSGETSQTAVTTASKRNKRE